MSFSFVDVDCWSSFGCGVAAELTSGSAGESGPISDVSMVRLRPSKGVVRVGVVVCFIARAKGSANSLLMIRIGEGRPTDIDALCRMDAGVVLILFCANRDRGVVRATAAERRRFGNPAGPRGVFRRAARSRYHVRGMVSDLLFRMDRARVSEQRCESTKTYDQSSTLQSVDRDSHLSCAASE